MLFADAMERADDAALDDRPEVLDRVRMTAQTQAKNICFVRGLPPLTHCQTL
jgi:hypothetical protein